MISSALFLVGNSLISIITAHVCARINIANDVRQQLALSLPLSLRQRRASESAPYHVIWQLMLQSNTHRQYAAFEPSPPSLSSIPINLLDSSRIPYRSSPPPLTLRGSCRVRRSQVKVIAPTEIGNLTWIMESWPTRSAASKEIKEKRILAKDRRKEPHSPSRNKPGVDYSLPSWATAADLPRRQGQGNESSILLPTFGVNRFTDGILTRENVRTNPHQRELEALAWSLDRTTTSEMEKDHCCRCLVPASLLRLSMDSLLQWDYENTTYVSKIA